jgi:arylsulfatase A-like enzyme
MLKLTPLVMRRGADIKIQKPVAKVTANSKVSASQPAHMVDVMPTALALAGAAPNPASKPLDGKKLLPMLTEGKPSPHDDLLINVEAFRGAIIKGQRKLVKIALLPGKIELSDLEADPGEKNNVAEQNPEVVRDLEARLQA